MKKCNGKDRQRSMQTNKPLSQLDNDKEELKTIPTFDNRGDK